MAQFITDFADLDVVFPISLAILVLLLARRRSAVVWLGVVVASFGLILLLKLGLAAWGSPLPGRLLHSPSGHTMAGTVAYGGTLVLLGAGARASAVAATLIAAVIAWSRVALGDHTLPEVLIGAAVGVGGVMLLRGLVDRPGSPGVSVPMIPHRGLLLLAVLVTALLLHGRHSNAEDRIQRIAIEELCPLLRCADGRNALRSSPQSRNPPKYRAAQSAGL